MKKHVFLALVAAGSLAAAQAHAACTYPTAPGKFPDGAQASLDDMKAAKAEVVKYNAEMDTYLGCIKTEFDAKVASTAGMSEKQKAEMERMQSQKHNAAVEEVTAVTERFNEQLRAYKAKAAAEKKSS